MRSFKRYCLVTAASVGFVTGSSVYAQSNPSDAVASESSGEIMVTAQRRSERLQDVPASISVVSSEQLSVTNAKDYRDYLNDVPGVTFTDNGYRASRVIIRGVSDGFAVTAPLTGIYIDEAPVTEGTAPSFDPSLYDVERVEILRGPQGTLYGSGSMGGTVRVITTKPKLDTFEGSIDGTIADVAHGGQEYRANAALNAPVIGDKVAIRLVGSYRHDDGYIDDPLRGKSDINDVTKYNIRGQVLIQPEPDTSLVLSGMYQKEDLGAPNFSDIGLPSYEQARVYAQSGKNEAQLYGSTLNHDFGDAQMVLATNYLHKTSLARIDATASFRPIVGMLTGVAIPTTQGLGIPTNVNYKLFTQELRLSSTGKRRLEWVLGAYYADGKEANTQSVDISQAAVLQGIVTGPGLLDATVQTKTRQMAAFGELTYHLTDKLSATAGLRISDAKQRAATTASGILNGGSVSTREKASDSPLTQKYALKYEFTRDNQVYAQAAQGFRLGGPNGTIPPICNADLAAIGYSSAPSSYGPDKLWSYEIGSKNSFFGHALTVNASAYYIDWTDIQTTISLPTCGFNFQVNAGKARSKGLELETSLRPLEGLTLNAQVAYNDAKLVETVPGTALTKGARLPGAARWAGGANARYDVSLSDSVDGFVYAGANYTGKRWNQFSGLNARSVLQDAYWLVDARAGVKFDRLSVSVFATNILDEKPVLFTATSGARYEVIGEPRVIGLSSTLNF